MKASSPLGLAALTALASCEKKPYEELPFRDTFRLTPEMRQGVERFSRSVQI